MSSCKKYIVYGLFLIITMSCASQQPSVLVFSKTEGFRHNSIDDGKTALMKMGRENNFHVDTTENANIFTSKNLKKYNAIIFLSTTGDIFNQQQEKAFKDFIQNGGGFVGIHAATNTEPEWPWFIKLVGACFVDHPKVQPATLIIKEKNHPSTKFLQDTWQKTDEWYNFKDINPDLNILITIDESSYKGGTNGKDHPISWYHKFDGGKVFYTAMGHTKESYTDQLFLNHLLGGIQYVISKK